MNDRRDHPWWAVLTAALCVVSAVLVFVSGFGPQPYGPISFQRNHDAYVITAANDAMRSQGVRPGDRIARSSLSYVQRYRLGSARRGEIVEVPIETPGGVRVVRGPATIPQSRDPDAPLSVVVLLSLLFCAYLGVRRPGAMTFALALFAGGDFLDWYQLPAAFSSFPAPLFAIVMAVCRTAANLFPPFALASFAARLPGGEPSAAKRKAIRIVDAIVIAAFVLEISRDVTGFTDYNPAFETYAILYELVGLLLVLAAVTIAYRLSPREQLGRVSVVVAAVAFAALTYAFSTQGEFTLSSLRTWFVFLFYLAGLALPASLAYAILRHRIFDLAFVLNRTLVYAITSGIVIVAFALLELLAERYLNQLTHVESLAIQLGIALAVVIGARAVHGRVDDLVDRVIFRERHEQEHALLRFATTVQFYTQQDALLEATVDAMIRYARVGGAALYLVEGGALGCKSSRFCDAPAFIDENDSAYADLRAHGQTIETREYATAFSGERVYPMVLIGRVTGALVLGGRESGEAMPPDIDEAVKRVVAAVAIATESIQAARVRKELEALRGSPFAARSAHL